MSTSKGTPKNLRQAVNNALESYAFKSVENKNGADLRNEMFDHIKDFLAQKASCSILMNESAEQMWQRILKGLSDEEKI